MVAYSIPGTTHLTDDPIAIKTDGGPWAEHNMPCPICKGNKAIMDLDGWVFHPCGSCRQNGWVLKKSKFLLWLRKFL